MGPLQKFDDLRILKVEDSTEAAIESQRLRGVIAKQAGFKAVEMSDEHGLSYLVLPGVRIVQVKPNDLSASADSDAINQKSSVPEAINVDGVERPTRNSKGQLINPTEEGVRNFWRWFGDSKVVDADGKPLVVYHGTKADIIKFDKRKSRINKGFFFSNLMMCLS